MKTDTREKLMQEAETLFVEKGFYGTSINDIASAVGVSKQGLLHHFPSKEKLYASVLERAATQLEQVVVDAHQRNREPVQQLQYVFQKLSAVDSQTRSVCVLLMRELMDNHQRIDNAKHWFMRPFLNSLEEMVKQAQTNGCYDGLSPLAFIYQLLGAVQYYLISIPTLQKLYSVKEFKAHQREHFKLLESALSQ